MNIALCQLNFVVGDLQGNKQKIISSVLEAKKKGAQIALFSELCISGYPPKDFLEYPAFTSRSQEVIEELLPYSEDICIVVGAPFYKLQFGKNLHNSAFVLYQKKVIKQFNKWLLPTYDVFDEYRYFEVGDTDPVFTLEGKKIALTICEDIWDEEFDKLYKKSPLETINNRDIDLILNLSASPYNYTHFRKRVDIIKKNTLKYKAPMAYVNQIGANTELVFDGGSLVIDKQGHIKTCLPFFTQAVQVIDFKDLDALPNIAEPEESIDFTHLHDALVLGVKDYFEKLGFKKAVLGLSGGIDSAMVLYIATKALGAENVLSVLMPSKYSSEHSISDSIALCESLGSPYETISIEAPVESIEKQLHPLFKGLPQDITEENIQSRTRGLLLMALSNKLGHLLLNTTNKSEAAVGYGTLYGDMCGALSVIGDVYKSQLYALARFINSSQEIIPKNIITKAPSAELKEDQKDSDSLPSYDVLDAILFAYIEEQKGAQEIIQKGFEPDLVNKVLRLVNRSEFKRFQMAPILRVSPKAFGFSRKIPIVGKHQVF